MRTSLQGFSLGLLALGALLSPACVTEPSGTGRDPECGNDIVETGEVCDGNYCSDDCQSEVGSCGDGIVQSEFGEACEPGEAGMGGGSGEGGALGEGGAGATAVVGCADTCTPEGGYICYPEENECRQTGLSRDALVEDHIEEMCEYFITLWGGTGNQFSCEEDGETYIYTADTVEDCVDALEAEPGCTVGEVEDFTLGKSRCDLAETPAPCFVEPD